MKLFFIDHTKNSCYNLLKDRRDRMKKIGKILFTFLFMTVGIAGIGNVSARELQFKYDSSYYEYYLTGGNDKLDMQIIESSNDIINKAVAEFYTEASGAEKVNIVPFSFTVQNGKTWDSKTDNATMYINIPKELNLEKSDQIYLMRINSSDGSKYVYDIGEKYPGVYLIKNYTDIKSATESATIFGKNISADFLSNQFAVLETSDFEATGTTYYALITCKGEVPIVTPPTKPTPTNPTQPTPTEPTTVENPKTADVSSQLYIVIGAICLAGVVGLGVKFAKANK